LKRILRSATFLSTCFLAAAALAPAQVVISQVYGGGGNAGSTYKNDFIEIFNRGAAAQNLNGWSVQYASATGTSWQVTNLSNVTLQPGQYYLIQEAQGAGGTTNLPAPDATGTIPMSGTAGKVALVNTTTALNVACPAGASIQDFVGFGTTANCSETAPTPAPSNTVGDLRAANGCTDTGNNSTDFSTATPNPRNTSSATNVCGSGPALTIGSATPLTAGTLNTAYSFQFTATGGSGGYTWALDSGTFPTTLSISPSGLLSGTPTQTGTFNNIVIRVTDSSFATITKTFSITINAQPTCTPTQTISQIQGSGSTSPVVGQSVTTRGIVTGKKSNGFFIQSADADADSDPNTSEGVFVFTSSSPAGANIGDLTCVTGQVQEFAPDPNGPTTTEIAGSPTFFSLTTGNALPVAVTITAANLNPNGPLDPLEKYEGMRVQFASLTTIAPTQGTVAEASATSSSNGVFYAVVTGVDRPTREPGVQVGIPLPAGSPANIPRWDFNPERLRIDSDALGAPPLEVTSNVVLTNVVGIVDYGFYTTTIDIEATNVPGKSANLSASPSATPQPEELTVAGFNMERFFDTTDDPGVSDVVLTAQAFANRLNKTSLAIRNSLNSPDIIALEEMENLTTLQALASKVNSDTVAASQPDPQYTAYLVEGNDVGGIDVGFLVKQSRVSVIDVTQYGKTATFTDPSDGSTDLIFDRPPLVLRARAARPGSTTTMPITVMALHLRSLGNNADLTPTGSRVRSKRRAGAEYVANLIQSRQLADANENIVVVGDFNAFDVNDGYVDVTNTIRGVPATPDTVVLASPALVNPTLTNVLQLVPAARRYSYSFDGDTQFLDHMLVNQPLMTKFSRADVAHNNADFPESFRNDPNRPERMSDHDMPIAYFTLPVQAAPSSTDVTGQVSITSTGLIYSRVSRVYTATVTITNTSGSPIDAPLQFLVTNLAPAGTTLVNATGTTGGNYYITAQSTGTLAAGASITVGAQFGAPAGTTITYTPKLYSGAF